MKKRKYFLPMAMGLFIVSFGVYQGASANPVWVGNLVVISDLPRPTRIFEPVTQLLEKTVSIPKEGQFFQRPRENLTILQERPIAPQEIKSPQGPGIQFFPRPISKNLSNSATQKVPRIIKEIEHKFDREKYEAFKVFSEDESGKKVPKSDKAVVLHIQTELGKYQQALVRAAQKAEVRRLHLVRYLLRESQGFHLTPKTIPYVRTVFSSFLNVISPWVGPASLDCTSRVLSDQNRFSVNPENLRNTRTFLENNLTEGGLPLSYQCETDYWKQLKSPMDRVDSVLERVIVKYSVNIYDSAVWQIALSVFESDRSSKLVDAHTQRMISGTSGRLQDIRAYGPDFKYGEKRKVLKRDNAFFFRIIADEYIQEDPLGENELEGYPNFKTVHHEDWKPITGEQAWAAIIGPIQVAYEKYGEDIPLKCPEMRLAMSILPALEAMESRSGAIYHAPAGTHGKNPHDISNENNFSMYAALRMLYQSLEKKDPFNAERVRKLLRVQERYFRKYAYDQESGIFYQGGFYVEGEFIPTRIFAVDCQTWGIASLGVEKVDAMFGEGTSYKIWKNTVQRAGYFDEFGSLMGVGFTDDHRILSVEWTCGAILATRKMAEAYRDTHPDWARECALDAVSMRHGVEEVKTHPTEDSTAYLYANNRYFIPFGWWANPIPSLVSSAWIILIDLDYDPFILGGGPSFVRS